MPGLTDQDRTDDFLDGIGRQAHRSQMRAAASVGLVGIVCGLEEMRKPGPGTPAEKFARGAKGGVFEFVSLAGLVVGVVWFLAAFGFGSGGGFSLGCFILGVLCCTPYIYLKRRTRQR